MDIASIDLLQYNQIHSKHSYLFTAEPCQNAATRRTTNRMNENEKEKKRQKVKVTQRGRQTKRITIKTTTGTQATVELCT